MVRWPEDYILDITVLFGIAKWDSAKVSPMLRQVLNDIGELSPRTGLDEYTADITHEPSLLFTDPDVRRAFLSSDAHVLAQAWSSVCIPPPDAEDLFVADGRFDLPWLCTVRGDDGRECGLRSGTHLGLVMHQV